MLAVTIALALSLLAAPPAGGKKGISLDPAVAADPDSVARLQAHLYHSSPTDLAGVARSMLESKGFVVPDHEDPLTLATEWKADKKGGRTRYVVRVVAMSVAASRVQFVREHDDGGASDDMSTSDGGDVEKNDDLDAAWAMLSRLEPDAAEEIRKAAPPLPPSPRATPPPRKAPAATP